MGDLEARPDRPRRRRGRRITVTGSGSASATPDLVTIRIGVNVSAATVGAANTAAANTAGQLIGALHDNGVEPVDVQTANFSIHPEYDHRNGPARVVGYRVTNTVRVMVRDVDRLGEILGAAVDASGDAAVVDGLEFGHQDPTALVSAARAAAWSDALERAEELAAHAGLRLGQALSIDEGTPPTSGGPLRRSRSFTAEAAAAPPIETGSVGVSVILNVTFAAQSDADAPS